MKVGKLLTCLNHGAYRRALVTHRVAAGIEHRSSLTSIGPCDVVIDIGANRGQFALAARRHNPTATIHSFEPLPAPAAIYRAVFANDEKASLQQIAIAPSAGETSMHVSARDDSSSLLPITVRQEAIYPGTQEVGTLSVRTAPLAAVLSQGSFDGRVLLKIDVQGFELSVLEGCEEYLSAFAHVYVECSFVALYEGQALAHEVVAWLAAREMQLRGVYNISYHRSGSAIQADFLFGR